MSSDQRTVQLQIVIPTLENKEPEDLENHFPLASVVTFIIYEVLLTLRESLLAFLYPEWPHRQCVGLAFRRSPNRGSLSAVSLVICSPARIAV